MMVQRSISGARARPYCCRARCALRKATALATVCGLSIGIALAAPPPKGPQPALRIQLDALGYQSPPQDILLKGYSTIALHFVDDGHILLTYNSRSLLRRIPDDPPDDSDQNVTALLLEAPHVGGPEVSKVVASTEWRLHDHAQYLWPLGHGRFLLRQGLQMRLLAPLDHLHTANPLASRVLMTLPNSPASLQISPDGKLMVLQMENRPPDVRETSPDSGPPRMQVGASMAEKTYDIQFVQMSSDAASADQVASTIVGEQRAAYPLDIPILPSGYLNSTEVAPEQWQIAYGAAVANGKRRNLFNIVSTCRPAMQFLSEEEFLLASCQRDQGKYSQGGYTLDGKELWRYDFPEPDGGETLRIAEDAGRFALGRILTAYPLSLGQPLSPAVAIAQDIRVYDARSGEQVFQINATPMQTDGRNYALSPDGTRFAVVEDGSIDVFNLPPVGAGAGKK